MRIFLAVIGKLCPFSAITLNFSCRCFERSPSPPMAERRGRGTNAARMGTAGQWPGAPSLALAAKSVGVGTAPTLPMVETEPHRPTIHRRRQQLRAPLAIALRHPFSSLAHARSLRSAPIIRKTSATSIEEYHENTESLRAHPSITIASLSKERQIENFCNYLTIRTQREKNMLKYGVIPASI